MKENKYEQKQFSTPKYDKNIFISLLISINNENSSFVKKIVLNILVYRN